MAVEALESSKARHEGFEACAHATGDIQWSLPLKLAADRADSSNGSIFDK